MGKCLEIGICSPSFIMNGIEESLKAQENLRIIRLGNSLAEAAMEIKLLFPHAVIFEMGGAKQTDIAAILQKYPHIRLIGLDPERDAITVFSASEQKVSSVDELAQIILKCTGEQEQQAR
jgi:hypothetical protein